MNDLVTLTAASRVFGGRSVLDRVTLSIEAGEMLAVMGPSGSGKSTLLNLIAGLDRPTSGDVRVAGKDLGRLGEAAVARHRRRHVGMIFQFFNLLDDLSVLDNVALPAQLEGARAAEARERALDLCRRLRIADKVERHPSTLSGGERQRVAIARALINRPELLLADEPTGALDSANGDAVIALLLDLHRAGQTIVLVTHEQRIAERCTGRLVRLRDGRVESADERLMAAVR